MWISFITGVYRSRLNLPVATSRQKMSVPPSSTIICVWILHVVWESMIVSAPWEEYAVPICVKTTWSNYNWCHVCNSHVLPQKSVVSVYVWVYTLVYEHSNIFTMFPELWKWWYFSWRNVLISILWVVEENIFSEYVWENILDALTCCQDAI